MKLERYKANRRGLMHVLGSEGVRLDLAVRANAVAVVARAEYRAVPPHEGTVEVAVESERGSIGSPRARATVIARHPGAEAIEADRRPLGSALDAARI